MKNITRILMIFSTLLLLFSLSACKPKKKRRNLIEVNPISTGTEIKHFGAQPQRGSDPNAPVIVTAPIYVPMGMDETGKRQYEKVLVELEELKPEYIDEGLKYYGVVSEDSLFGALEIVSSDETINVGPGATDNQVIDKRGIVRYLDLGTDLDNSDNYKDVTDTKKLKGKIDYDDIMHCILATFQENFQLVDCEFDPMTEEEYYKIHPKKS